MQEYCDKGNIKFNENTGKFKVNASADAKCNVIFQAFNNVKLNLYYNGIKTLRFHFNEFTYKCKYGDVNIDIVDKTNGFLISSSDVNNCDIYYTNVVKDSDNNE